MRRTAPLAALALFALVPSLAAQDLSFSPYTARSGGLPDAPALVGLAVTGWTGPVGLRVSGGMDLPSSPVAPLLGHPPSDATAAWHGDVDLVLGLGRAGLRAGAIEPAIFTGFGFHGRQRNDGSRTTIPVWSYGGGVAVRLVSWLSLDLESRYRLPHETDAAALPTDVGGGWESRAGLAVHFGRSGAAPQPAPLRASSPARGSSTRSTAGTPTRGAPAVSADAAAVARQTLSTADAYVGVPYVWGGNSPSEGFDCSGFVRYVFARQGITLPRVSRDQARAGEWLPPRVENLAPGDLMFYAGSDGVVNHVAIYAGDNRIIHSSSTGRGVRYDDLGSRRGRYYATRMVAARRVIRDGASFFGVR